MLETLDYTSVSVLAVHRPFYISISERTGKQNRDSANFKARALFQLHVIEINDISHQSDAVTVYCSI